MGKNSKQQVQSLVRRRTAGLAESGLCNGSKVCGHDVRRGHNQLGLVVYADVGEAETQIVRFGNPVLLALGGCQGEIQHPKKKQKPTRRVGSSGITKFCKMEGRTRLLFSYYQ